MNSRLRGPTSVVQFLALAGLALATACGGATQRASRGDPSNDLLIVGYDREPDTMNRYSTHILEDIQSCVVEGLVTHGDAARTAEDVMASEGMFRLGIASLYLTVVLDVVVPRLDGREVAQVLVRTLTG